MDQEFIDCKEMGEKAQAGIEQIQEAREGIKMGWEVAAPTETIAMKNIVEVAKFEKIFDVGRKVLVQALDNKKTYTYFAPFEVVVGDLVVAPNPKGGFVCKVIDLQSDYSGPTKTLVKKLDSHRLKLIRHKDEFAYEKGKQLAQIFLKATCMMDWDSFDDALKAYDLIDEINFRTSKYQSWNVPVTTIQYLDKVKKHLWMHMFSKSNDVLCEIAANKYEMEDHQ